MSTTSAEIAGRIDEKVREIEDEIRKLEAAKAALLAPRRIARDDTERIDAALRRERGSRRSFAAVARRRGTTRRKGPGAEAQVLELVKARPGISSTEIKERAAVKNKTYAYSLIKRLQGKGLIEGDHKGWSPAAEKVAK